MAKRNGPQTETDRQNDNEGTAKDGSTSKEIEYLKAECRESGVAADQADRDE